MIGAARAGDAAGAIAALGAFRAPVCPPPRPVRRRDWNELIESWLAEDSTASAPTAWYVGRPLLVTENDYSLRLFNGDTGVIVATATAGESAAFERRGELVEFSPDRLDAVDTVYAMTIHKSQGSQFDTVAVLLPTRRRGS